MRNGTPSLLRTRSLLLCVGALVLLGTLAAAPRKQRTEKEGYVGTEACLACHEDLGKAFLGSRHGRLDADAGRGWKGQVCESCHGPGAKHGEAAEAKFILNHAKASPREADANCLSCHRQQATHAGKIGGSHAKVQVGCLSCHSVHHAIADPALPLFRSPGAAPSASIAAFLGNYAPPSASGGPGALASKQQHTNALCAGCHSNVVADFQRPHTHPVAQGAVSCTDCHNPHATLRQAALQGTARTANNEPGCFRCHADKRGPFAFEHAPMRLEGCGSCHEAHGSANPRMLTRHSVVNLCLECHSNLPGSNSGTLGGVATAFHDLRLPAYQNCTTCHTKVHGSHASKDLLR